MTIQSFISTFFVLVSVFCTITGILSLLDEEYRKGYKDGGEAIKISEAAKQEKYIGGHNDSE